MANDINDPSDAMKRVQLLSPSFFLYASPLSSHLVSYKKNQPAPPTAAAAQIAPTIPIVLPNWLGPATRPAAPVPCELAAVPVPVGPDAAVVPSPPGSAPAVNSASAALKLATTDSRFLKGVATAVPEIPGRGISGESSLQTGTVCRSPAQVLPVLKKALVILQGVLGLWG